MLLTLPERMFLLICVCVEIAECWHDLSNAQFHCWPFGANDNNPESFPVCVGVDLDWIEPPPEEIMESTGFSVIFSLVLLPEFYSWAVQDAQDNFKKNLFSNLDGSPIVSNNTAAKEWCEDTQCPTDCSSANQENCCLHHVNVHSCPEDEVRFGLCPPWLPSDGEFYTHSQVTCGSSLKVNWTAEISGLHLKNGKTTPTVLISHFKIATMHVALNWRINVLPQTVCGDESCDDNGGEDCMTCPGDCGKCPLSLGSIIGIVIAASLVLAFVFSGLGYIKYNYERLLWDESWIVDYSEIKSPEEVGDTNMAGSVLHIPDLLGISHAANNTNENNTTLSSRSKLGVCKGQLCVLKSWEKKNFKLTKQIRMEVKQIRRLDHTNLMTFVGACLESPNYFILTKHCSKGNLRSVLTAKHVPISWAFRFSFANDIVRGLTYLHSHYMVHGCLKIENCLVDDRWTVKLTDFGVPSLRTYECGTYNEVGLWRAPELEMGENSEDGDIYAYGLIVVQISTRCDIPVNESDNLATVKMDWQNKLTRNELGDVANKCPCPRAIDMLVNNCMCEKPASRPTSAAVKKQLKTLNPAKMSAVDLMMMMMEKYSKHLESIVAERTQDLVTEKQRTDELLHAMLPKQVADDLRMGRSVAADSFECCTVYFSDIVGFTSISGSLPALEVVTLLNKLYSCFDQVIDKHDVYKVETIGDAYMVVSGVPIRNGGEHAINIANMALDLLHESKLFVIPNMPNEPLKIRIGLHSGPVCAGVVGMKMPRYCLFGDTVNTASRMESNGEAYKIHMSNNTMLCLTSHKSGQSYNITRRGFINVKGKGDMLTWWLEGKRDDHTAAIPALFTTCMKTAPLPPINVPTESVDD